VFSDAKATLHFTQSFCISTFSHAPYMENDRHYYHLEISISPHFDTVYGRMAETTYGNVHDSGRPATAVVRERDGMIDGSAHLLSSCRSTRGPTPLTMPHRSSEMREVVMLTVYLHVRQPYNVDGVTDHLPPPCPAVPAPRALCSRYSPFVHSGYVVLPLLFRLAAPRTCAHCCG
jgi:hypothetical protein